MHIQAICPSCGTCYRLEPDMRGKRMRCQNQACRAVFEVREETKPDAFAPAEKPASSPGPRQVTGSVTDLVPLLPAEALPESNVPPRKKTKPTTQPQIELPSIPELPSPAVEKVPVSDIPEAIQKRSEELPPDLDWGPLNEFFKEDAATAAEANADPSAEAVSDVTFDAFAPPPVRAPGAAEVNGTPPQPALLPEIQPEPTVPKTTGRKTWRAIALMLGAVALLSGIIFWQMQRQQSGNESQRLAAANELYKDHNFEDAADRYAGLARDFPGSPELSFYRLAAELSGLREPVYRTQTDAEDLQNISVRLIDFVAGHKGDPLLDRFQGDLWDTFTRLSARLAEAAEERHDPKDLDLASRTLEEAVGFKAPSGAPGETRPQQIRERLATVRQSMAAWQRKQNVLVQLKGVLAHFSFDGRQKALHAVERAHLQDDPEITPLLTELPARHRASVTYQKAKPLNNSPGLLDDAEPSLLVVLLLKESGREPTANERVVLSLVRGVLYAFEPETSQVRWFRRVSLDSPGLPVRVPRTPSTPELVLTLAADSQTFVAVDAELGSSVWQHRCQAPCLASPVLVGNRVFFPTQDGHVEEVETTRGMLLGSYDLGQPLTAGGTRQAGTNLVYFPADSDTIYVLDVAARKCVSILYTGHPPGSIRFAPRMIPQSGRWLLLLAQDNGLEDVKLRVFALPASVTELPTQIWEKSLHGWSYFPPYVDSERFAQVTDDGRFVLYGIGSQSGGGPNLFPWIVDGVVLGENQTPADRAEIVHADAERFWVLALGELHKLGLTFDRRQGPRIVQRPLPEAAVGSALHAAQVRTDAGGRQTLFLATQAKGQALATALEDSGRIVWQRQLGLLCRGQPVRLGKQILAEDQGGSLFVFGGEDFEELPGGAWRLAGKKVPGPERPTRRYFLPGPDGNSAFVVSSTAGQAALTLQVIQAGKDPSMTSTFPQQAALAGPPALGTDGLLLALADSVLVRQPLPDGPPVAGPNWRATQADENATAFVVPLGKDDFLVTDGSRGLQRLHWPAGAMADSKTSAELTSRIIAAPLVLPSNPSKGEGRICIADAGNTLTLLSADTLESLRSWVLDGKITAGPFLRGKSIACILDHRRLVWLDSDRGVVWNYGLFGADIVGEPQLVGQDLLVVADVSGRFTGIDVRTGQERGRGYTLKASAAPAAAPVACGAGLLFAPLTDGTILLLHVKYF